MTTPQVSRESAAVKVTAELRNDDARSQICNLKFEISGPDGQVAAAWTCSPRAIAPGQTIEIEATSGAVANPRLWHPDHPHLYSLRTQLCAGDAVVDELATPFGFRWFDWTADRGCS